jgi:hypothetical protein
MDKDFYLILEFLFQGMSKAWCCILISHDFLDSFDYSVLFRRDVSDVCQYGVIY